ncbi:MAG: poly-gamma-glutamate hydrolase family protein [Bryobacterales bacterium]|nr:poly-gamma-glutamate hydrolase family protein [Bryobacterales bacterium]
MADRYSDFAELSRNEVSGIDYRILIRRAGDAVAVAAPHGGGIEPGTSEIAEALAGGEFSFYAFEGLKRSGNGALHITSTRFDEPMCAALMASAVTVVTVHGEDSDAPGEGVFLGGLDDSSAGLIGAALQAHGFPVRRHPDPGLQGREPANLCNRGTSGKGVQLELSRTIRSQMFPSLTREGRRCRTARFYGFVEAVRSVLAVRLPATAR